MKFAVLALLGLVTLEEVVAKHHKHHHHHKHHKKHHNQEQQSLAQGDEEKAPAATPASNRSAFEKSVSDAAATVATQQKFESDKTADVAKRNAANTLGTSTLKASVTTARQQQIQGEFEHKQWVTRGNQGNWAQVSSSEEPAAEAPAAEAPAADAAKPAAAAEAPAADAAKPAAAPKADAKAAPADAAPADAAPADAAPADAKAEKAKDAKTVIGGDEKKAKKVKKQNPQNSYDSKAESLKEVLRVTAEQRAFQAKSDNDVATAQAKFADSAENIKNYVRVNRRVQANGGLNHDDAKLYLPKNANYETLAQADPVAAKGEEAKGPAPQNPENSYKEKKESLTAVLEATAAQRAFEAKSNADVAAAQDKYFKATEDQKNAVKVARRIQANGGLDHRSKNGKYDQLAKGGEAAPKQNLVQAEKRTPDESRKSFESQVKEASATVATQNGFETAKTIDVAKRNAANVKDTFNEKRRVRSGRVAMMRGGPKGRYGGGQSLAQSSSDSSDSESDDERQQVALKNRKLAQKQSRARSASSSSSGSDSD